MVSDLLTHVARLEMVDVDLDKEPQCEGIHHRAKLWGHDDGPARFRVIFPCACSPKSVMACAGRAWHFREFGSTCHVCGRYDEGADLIVIEL